MIIRRPILKTNITKEALVEEKYQYNYSAIDSQNEYKNYKDCDPVKDKYKTRPSEATEDTKKEKKKSQIIRTNVSISMAVCKITILVRS